MTEGRKLDLRIERTYRMLCEAFERLLGSKHYEDVTVSDLCDQAMIRRTTFYKHFADKDEFFAFYVRHVHDEFERRSAPAGGYRDPLDCHTRMTHELMAFIRENDRLIRLCLTSSAFTSLDAVLADEMRHSFQQALEVQARQGHVFCANPEALVRYACGGFLASLYEFVKTHDPVTQADTDAFEQTQAALAAHLLTARA